MIVRLPHPKAYFKDADGKTIFYPYGPRGKGFIVDIYRKGVIEDTIAAFRRYMVFVGLAAVILYFVAGGGAALLAAVPAAALAMLAHRVRLRDALTDLEETSTQFTRREFVENRAKYMSGWRVMFRLVSTGCAFLSFSGAFLDRLLDSPWLILAVLAVFMLLSLWAFLDAIGRYQIWWRHQRAEAEDSAAGGY